MLEFRRAVESRDGEAMAACLADNVRFVSPVAFKAYEGKDITAAILRGVMRVFGDFHYTRELTGTDGREHALVFETSVAGKHITGCDFLHMNEAGLIDELMVMVRPLSGAQALAESMAAEFEQITAEAIAARARRQRPVDR